MLYLLLDSCWHSRRTSEPAKQRLSAEIRLLPRKVFHSGWVRLVSLRSGQAKSAGKVRANRLS